MAAPVIRRAARPASVTAPVVEKVEEPALARGWLGGLRAQVAGAFREHGAKVFNGDPMKHCRGERRDT